MAESILKDQKRILPCAAYCDKEYDVGGYFVGVPVMLGVGGVEKVIEIQLTAEEKVAFDNSVAAVKELVVSIKL
jgi:malate dehydrogenase